MDGRYRTPASETILVVALLLIIFLPGAGHTQSLQDVVISEIAWMGTTMSADDEWVELRNNTASSIGLTGWTLTAADGTPSVTLAGSIPAGGHFLLERTDDSSVPGVAADQLYTGSLSNTGENLILRDAASTIIDQVDCSTGWFSGHSDARVPMARLDPLADGSVASNWTYSPRCGSATNSAGVSHTCTLTTTYVSQPLDYAVYFDERATTATDTTTEHTPMEDALLHFIGNATASIDAAVYGLDRQSIVDALIAAHNRGVTVRIVGDDEAATGEYAASYQALSINGIQVVTDTTTSKIQHNKFLVIDGQVVWTGSTNFTDTGFTLNANNSIVMTDTVLAGTYATEFVEMWSGAFHESKSDNTAHLIQYDDALVESYFSPTDLPAFEVWNELANAEQTIHFAMFFWTDDLLSQRVIERLQGGVQVYGVWDQLGAANVSSQDEALCAAGAHIGIEDLPGKVHHKFAVIDVEGDDPTVILGSYNWMDAGAYDNDENTLIIHDRALAQAYYGEWQTLWSAVPLENICNPSATYLPVVSRDWHPTPTPMIYCTPPPCDFEAGEVYHCPSTCPGGCGTVCATATPALSPDVQITHIERGR